jgi:trehalose-6-phosphatase
LTARFTDGIVVNSARQQRFLDELFGTLSGLRCSHGSSQKHARQDKTLYQPQANWLQVQLITGQCPHTV